MWASKKLDATQPSQTSDSSYITTKVPLNPNKPRFISTVSLLSNTMMPHNLPTSFRGPLVLELDDLWGGEHTFQPKLRFDPTVLRF